MAEDEPGIAEVAQPVPDPVPGSVPAPEPVTEAAPEEEEEASDLGSPGFDTSHPPAHVVMPPHPAEATGFSEVSHDVSQDLYQPASSGLSYPQGVGIPEDMSNTDYFQQHPASNGISYPQHTHQMSDAVYADAPSASRQHVPEPEPVPLQPVQPPSQSIQQATRTGTRRSLPSGSGQHQTDYADSADVAPTASSWQPTNIPNSAQAFSESPTISHSAASRQNRSRQSVAPPAYDTAAHDALQAATTLTHAALQQRSNTSPATRTASPFSNPTQTAHVARAKSRQSQRSQNRQTASTFPQSTTSQPTQPTAVGASSSLYNPPATDSDNLPSYDQYSRFNNAQPQTNTTSSRVAYEPYSQQGASDSSATPYSGYGAYNSRSQAPNASSLANPVTQSASSSYTKTAAPTSKTWASSSGRRSSNAYSSNKTPASSASAYSVPPTSAQQQSTNLQSFNVRPQSTAPTQSRTSGNTSASYAQQPRQQQPQQQPAQQTYNSYSSQPHPTANQQQQQQQQQEWYGFGSANSATSNYGSGSYSQHRSMNLAGNTYTSMNDQEALYEMLRNNPRH